MTETPAERLPRWSYGIAGLAVLLGWLWLRNDGGDQASWRIAMSGVGAGLLLVHGVLRDRAKRGFALALVAWAGLAVGAMVGRPIERLALDGDVSEWSFFHYYLGAKYFDELGYDGLYEQALAADYEGPKRLSAIPLVRNLVDYSFEPPAAETRRRAPEWSEARWEEFKADLAYFYRPLRKRWIEVLTDRGYNATPVWNTTGWLLSHLPASEAGFAIIAGLDTALLLLAAGVMVVTFGPVRGMLALAFLLLFYGNQVHVVGRPFLHDYAASLMLFVSAVHTGRARWAAVLLAHAAMIRIFPGFFLGGLAVWSFVQWRRSGVLPAFTRRFAPAFLAACLGFVVYGSLNGRGPHAWVEFAQSMAVHSEDHRFGGRRIGLQHFFTHEMGAPLDGRFSRRDVWEEQKPLWAACAVAMCLLWLAATLRVEASDPLDAMLLSMVVVFAAVVLSRYYWGVAGLFFLLGARDREGPWRGVAGALLLLNIAVFYVIKGTTPDTFAWFTVANGAFIVWFVFVLVGRLVGGARPAAAVEQARSEVLAPAPRAMEEVASLDEPEPPAEAEAQEP